MISHLFRLIWNKKKAHTLLIVEIWASFMVLFGLATLIVVNVGNYREPLGFAYENVWAIDLNNNQDTTEVANKLGRIVQQLKTYPEVESVSRMSSNFPFSANQMNDGVEYNKRNVVSDRYVTDENFAQTLGISVTDGKWYRNADSVGKYRPMVINEKAKEELFGNENALGKIVSDKFRVVGVMDNFKAKGEFMTNKPAVFELMEAKNSWSNIVLIKVKPGTDAVFEANVVKNIATMVKGWSVEVNYLTDSRKNQHNLVLVPVIIAAIVSGFLLINVALGLFGVLNLSIAKRRGEIGLRRAIGATGSGISTQFIGEIWVLATFAMLIGLLFAVQFPLLNVFDLASGTYMTAIGIAVLIIYGIVTLCALFPSRQAALIQPATALHEE
ncbi:MULTISPECIES: ABC transporter permease [Spirosoma]|uniref:ABC transporter permease n=1 Tax=Spirosoma liriopis TaxID=2937440 RepID=A0ABT0HIN9_9BACT|nr:MULTISPECIES: ABC transporter permease [Spirosoma]MCK8492030.1 ABC transporter permease [Spirosoma liriopis]UHG91452.1 ABC transporter permease [Spirosoma oryzicola]